MPDRLFYIFKDHTNLHHRVVFLMIVMTAGIGVLSYRLWQVQVVHGADYAAKIAANREVRVRIPPVRGEIRDRNGLLLVGNRSRYDIEFYLPEMVRGYRERSGGATPMLRYPGRVHGMARMLQEPNIVQIANTTVFPRLRELGLPVENDDEDLARHFRIYGEVPFTYLENVDFRTVAKFSEHDLGLPGVSISMEPMRYYPYGALASHILGYVGDPLDMTQLPDARAFDFYEANVEGKAQVELSMDKYLRGTAGVRVMQRNVRGGIDKELRVESPPRSNTVYLTIDARIQFIADQALRAVGRAGAVVVDPNNGDILAMASVPSFDPNTFVPSIPADEWKRLTDDETDPLTNRALGAFPPGSTFKLITALGGLRKGLAAKSFNCSGGVSYGDHYFKCWRSGGHGTLTLSDAVKVSCNAFFYQYGNAGGIDSIDLVGHLLGLGQASNIGLSGEQPGILPGPEWLKMNYPQERWSSAYTANVSIGQGFDLVSPLQLVMAYSAVANGGTSYQPRLIKTITDGSGQTLVDERGRPVIPKEPRVRANLADSGVTRTDLELLRTGLWKVVNEDGGTARRARLEGGIVAGKTGTAQAALHGRQDTIAWFVCFAPYVQPKFAVCVMVQGGAHGGSVAAPIAAKIMEETLAMERGDYQPLLAALPPARHRDPFRMIESINVESAVPRLAATDDDEPGGPSLARAAPRGGPEEFAAPRLKKSKPPSTRTAQRPPPNLRAQPAAPAQKNFFQWLLGPRSGR
jgi:penicillin-binding protein 2